MKPRNKLQEKVLALSKSLSPITESQKKYGEKNCFTAFYYHTLKGVTCFDCGHTWKPKTHKNTEEIICENCKTLLTPRSNKARKITDKAYYSIITTFKGFQLIRHYLVEKNCKAGQKAVYKTNEVSQTWIEPTTHQVTYVARAVMAFGMYYDNWVMNSEMEIKPSHARHIINPWKIYPRVKVIDKIRRNGFNGEFYDIAPMKLFHYLLTQPKFETLYKAGQASAVINYNSNKINEVWPSIKIAMRNNYIIADFSIWYDHIEMLKELGKDILNPKYVCPTDIDKEHERLNAKITAKREKEEQARSLRKLLENQEKKKQAEEKLSSKLKKFIDLKLTNGDIEIVPLYDIEDFIKEGAVMHHCVFTNDYYTKENSLILSARIGETRLETIEIDLEEMKLLQCRGKFNKSTPYHDTIVNTIKDNLSLISKMKRRRKKAA